MPIQFIAMPTETVEHYRSGGIDVYGNEPERQISSGEGVPCRHCLDIVPKGQEALLFAYRPFSDLHPYAETGPIFLCADQCARHKETADPRFFENTPDYLIKGYGPDDRIAYGTGRVVPTSQIGNQAQEIFQNPKVAYIHLRSARNNCYLCRIDRA